tara:strand:- start:3922 stop:4191 length:270 start_codon:yes stop_codon:yes gene_type:complete
MNKQNPPKAEYYITFMVRDGDGENESYPTIASGFSNLKTAIKFAEQTDGTVEIVAQYTFADGDIDDEGENGEYVNIGFIDGKLQYRDEG